MTTLNDNTLFAGAEDGVIYAWRGRSGAEGKCPFELAAVLDLNTLDCEMTLGRHTNTVTSLICWDTCLIWNSFDFPCKFCFKTEEGRLEVEYTPRKMVFLHWDQLNGKHILFKYNPNFTDNDPIERMRIVTDD